MLSARPDDKLFMCPLAFCGTITASLAFLTLHHPFQYNSKWEQCSSCRSEQHRIKKCNNIAAPWQKRQLVTYNHTAGGSPLLIILIICKYERKSISEPHLTLLSPTKRHRKIPAFFQVLEALSPFLMTYIQNIHSGKQGRTY